VEGSSFAGQDEDVGRGALTIPVPGGQRRVLTEARERVAGPRQ
jgi:hypothetical protein